MGDEPQQEADRQAVLSARDQLYAAIEEQIDLMTAPATRSSPTITANAQRRVDEAINTLVTAARIAGANGCGRLY